MNAEVALEIRPVQGQDLAGVAALDRSSGLTGWEESEYRGWLHRSDALFLGAFESGRLLGFILLWTVAAEAEILKIAAEAAARGRGVGQALLTAGLQAVRGVGCRTVFLEVRPGNAAALRLYLNNGFAQVGRRTGYYRNPEEDALVMRLEL